MAPVINARVIFNAIPTGYPEPGTTTVYDTTETIDPEAVALNGGFLVKVLALSVDPYMRGRMREAHVESYIPAFDLGQPLTGLGVGVVVRSENADVKEGAHVCGVLAHQTYNVLKDLTYLGVVERIDGLPWSAFLGVLGVPGKTAFMAWRQYSQAKKGETVFVSSGASAVGALVVQLAKRDGLKVIASAGSDEKVQFMKDIGADVAFNYKTTATAEVLAREGPIDVYWDNVGGETLDAALEAANTHARFIECGMISGYNSGGAPSKKIGEVVSRSISMFGFIVTNLEPRWNNEFYATLPPLVASGEIKHREEIFNGLESVGDALLAVLKGTNKAKAIVYLADE